MELLGGYLELYVTLNYHILLLLPPFLWVQEITFPLHLDGCVYTTLLRLCFFTISLMKHW